MLFDTHSLHNLAFEMHIFNCLIALDQQEKLIQSTCKTMLTSVTTFSTSLCSLFYFLTSHYTTPWLYYVGPCIIWTWFSFNSTIPRLWGAPRLCNVDFSTSNRKLSWYFKLGPLLWKETIVEVLRVGLHHEPWSRTMKDGLFQWFDFMV